MHQLILIAIAILLIPLISFVIIIFNQQKLMKKAHLVALPLIGVGLALALYVCYSKLSGISETLQWTTHWVNFGNVPGVGEWRLNMGVMIDNLTAIMLVANLLLMILY